MVLNEMKTTKSSINTLRVIFDHIILKIAVFKYVCLLGSNLSWPILYTVEGDCNLYGKIFSLDHNF